MNYQKINGLITATFSPFDSQGRLNLEVIPSYAAHLKQSGVQGVFINGTTGEGASLIFSEKKALTAAWATYNSADFKVIAMVSGTSQAEGIELAAFAQEQGIYGISSNAPFYVKPGSVESLTDYLKPIAEAAPKLAFYFYHIPLLTQVHLSMVRLLDVAGAEIPNFAGIKYTHTDLMEFNQCLRHQNSRFDILWGWDEMLLAGLAMGATGGVGSTYNYAAPLYQELIQAFEEKDLSKALSLQEKSIDIISHYSQFGGAVAGKAILKFCGIDCGDFRSPGNQLSDTKRQELREALDRIGFFKLSGSV
jgi:N-acetylneuraminate lyase